MNNFQQGTRLKLRFPTPTGKVSIERLWEFKGTKLPLLAAMLEELDAQLVTTTSDSLSFLKSNAPKKDWKIQLMFDIAKEVYVTLQGEADAAANAKDIKAHNEKYLALMAKNDEAALEGLTNEQLAKFLK